ADRRDPADFLVLPRGSGKLRGGDVGERSRDQGDALRHRSRLAETGAEAGDGLAADTGDLDTTAVLDRQHHRDDAGQREIRPLGRRPGIPKHGALGKISITQMGFEEREGPRRKGGEHSVSVVGTRVAIGNNRWPAIWANSLHWNVHATSPQLVRWRAT